jgi:hypothetical protein
LKIGLVSRAILNGLSWNCKKNCIDDVLKALALGGKILFDQWVAWNWKGWEAVGNLKRGFIFWKNVLIFRA